MKIITIMSVVDVLETLARDTVNDSVYLMDNNVDFGSTDQGKPTLKTKVAKGDRLVWQIMPLEIDSFVGIDGIEIDKTVCDPEKQEYPGTNVALWTGTIKKTPESTSYSIHYKVGSREGAMSPEHKPSLIG